MINVTRAYLPDRKKLGDYIDKIYQTAWLTNNSQFCQQLEARLQEYLGVKNLILVTNGTLALQVVYKALQLKGSVVTTPFSFIATTSSLLWEGIRPVFADINPQTWNMAPEEIEQRIAADTSAILPVHVFGNPCAIEPLEILAHKHNLRLVFDGAHAFGVKFRNKSVLNYGDASILSFHATKLFHTIEGGAVITSDDELAAKIRLMINFGISGPDRVECVGINGKMNEFQAAMGLCVLDEMALLTAARTRVWDYYAQNLSPYLQTQQWNSEGTQNYQYFPVLLKSEAQLKKVVAALNAGNIFPRRYFYPSLDMLPFVNTQEAMPVARDVAGRILCLPLYGELEPQEQMQIVQLLKSAMSSTR